MPVNLSIKNVPDDIVERLRRRAERNHRSLQGELMALVEAGSEEPEPNGVRTVYEKVKQLGLTSASDSVEIIRAMRDSRYGG